MRVSLINVGDGGRCLYDINNRVITVATGEIVGADLSETVVKRIQKFHRVDSLLVGPEGSITPPAKLKTALDILKAVDYAPYDDLLRSFRTIVPATDGGQRPNRTQIRKGCRGVIEGYLLRRDSKAVAPPAAPAPAVEPEAQGEDDQGADEVEAEGGPTEEAVDAEMASRSEASARQSGRRRSRR